MAVDFPAPESPVMITNGTPETNSRLAPSAVITVPFPISTRDCFALYTKIAPSVWNWCNILNSEIPIWIQLEKNDNY